MDDKKNHRVQFTVTLISRISRCWTGRLRLVWSKSSRIPTSRKKSIWKKWKLKKRFDSFADNLRLLLDHWRSWYRSWLLQFVLYHSSQLWCSGIWFEMGWNLLSMTKIPSGDVLEWNSVHIKNTLGWSIQTVQLESTWFCTSPNRIRIVQHGDSPEDIDALLSEVEDDGEKKFWSATPFTKLWRQKWENWNRCNGYESQEDKEIAISGKQKSSVRKEINAISGTTVMNVQNRPLCPPNHQHKEVEVRREKKPAVVGVHLGSPIDSHAKTSWKVFALNLWHLASSRMDGVHWGVATSTSKWTANERASLNTAKWFWLNDKDDTSLSLSVVLMCRYDSPEKGVEPECVCFSNEGKFVIYWKEDTSCVSSLQSGNDKNAVTMSLRKRVHDNCFAVFQDTEPPESTSILRKSTKNLGTNSTCTIHESYAASRKIQENKCPSLGTIQIKLPHQRSPYVIKFEDRSQEEIARQEQCARGDSWRLAQNIFELRATDKTAFFSSTNEWKLPAPSTIKLEEREFVVDS